jgi:hypothetical protein
MLIKIIQRTFVAIASIILFAVIALIIYLTFSSIKNKILFEKVYSLASQEFNKIQLEDELLDEQTEAVYGRSCSYDNKVRAIRCNTHFLKYYANNNDVVTEFKKVDTFLKSLGWKTSDGESLTEEQIEHTLSLGLTPYEIYVMDGEYHLDLHLTFYRNIDEECKYYCGDRVKGILEKYQSENNTMYGITLYTDMVDR